MQLSSIATVRYVEYATASTLCVCLYGVLRNGTVLYNAQRGRETAALQVQRNSTVYGDGDAEDRG